MITVSVGLIRRHFHKAVILIDGATIEGVAFVLGLANEKEYKGRFRKGWSSLGGKPQSLCRRLIAPVGRC